VYFLGCRLEKEKQELRDFLERDNKAMKDRMGKEEEDRLRKEQELKVKLFWWLRKRRTM
jgi:hypothetical protein